MPKCSECTYEGNYDLERGTVSYVTANGLVDGKMKYMRCQAPGGGATPNPISWREAQADMPCNYFRPKGAGRKATKKPLKKKRTFAGFAPSEVYLSAIEEIPDGMLFESQKVLRAHKSQSVEGKGTTASEAKANAEKKLPKNARVLDEEIVEPQPELIIVETRNEDIAQQQAKEQAPHLATIGKIILKETGKKGFLGLGRRPNKYEVEIIHPVVVRLHCMTEMRVSFTYGTSTADALQRVRKGHSIWEMAEQTGIEMEVDERLHKVVSKHPPGIPFLTAFEGKPIVLMRLDDEQADKMLMTKLAVKNNEILLLTHMVEFPEYPVFSHAFFILDDKVNPFRTEGFSPIDAADIQDFALALAKIGTGEFRLYAGDEIKLVTKGTFALADGDQDIPTAQEPENLVANLLQYSKRLKDAAEHLESIPERRRDHKAAVNQYVIRY